MQTKLSKQELQTFLLHLYDYSMASVMWLLKTNLGAPMIRLCLWYATFSYRLLLKVGLIGATENGPEKLLNR